MIKWFGKQFILGQIYYWAKERLSGLLLTIILLILVLYIHSQYLNFIEFNAKNEGSYIILLPQTEKRVFFDPPKQVKVL